MLDSASPQYQFVPVSLYVSMNVIYISSKFFVLQDLQLYDETQDEPCQARCNRCHRCHRRNEPCQTRPLCWRTTSYLIWGHHFPLF